MHLPSRLSSSTLGDLLGQLHRHRTSGQLELSELPSARRRSVTGREHRIHLEDGFVYAVDTGFPVRPLGELLWRRGLVGPEAIGRLLSRIGAGDRRAAGEILVAEGLIDARTVTLALRAQLRERMDALYEQIEDAFIRFHPPRPAFFPSRRSGPLLPTDFLHGRPRARDRRSATPRPAAPRPVPARPRDDARAQALRTLGLTGEPALADIRRAFRRLASELHPDCYPNAPADEQRRRLHRFAEISGAYHLLVG